MDLSHFYPSFRDLINNEMGVMKYLMDDPIVNAIQPQLAFDARNCHRSNKNSSTGFAFSSYIDLWHEPMHRGPVEAARPGKRTANVRLILSARIEVVSAAVSDVTYSFAVCRIRSSGVLILRKFHFDVTAGSGTPAAAKQQRPQCHLQYCGTLVPAGCRQVHLDQMHPWLSEPRILFWPMSLALLIDMALHEFPDERWRGFRETPEWRSLVRKHEALLLRPFHERCLEILINKKGENQTLAREFYVW
jgi:hypothetical protein